ncbi:MAG: acyltransferase family protein [Acidimicrobiia bacterium]
MAQGAPAPAAFRADIDGLRAVAILLVVAYHADVPGMGAGFLGVDVFFVISGFLITRLLVGELQASGTVALARFWARRARRLVPAAAVVTLFCLAAGSLVLSPLEWGGLATDGLATTTYWSNILFALRAGDYFHAGLGASPLLHTWSLAVEEQFYLAWPLVLLGIHRLARASGGEARRIRLVALGLVCACSFTLSLSLTEERSPWAFFLSASRAWELGAGALLAVALAPPTVAPGRRRGWWLLQPVGLALVVAGLASIGPGTPFPGTAALLPVLGTVALIAGGEGRTPLNRVLGAPPLQTIGRLSYSWYLWHWPFLVLGTAYLGRSGMATRIALVTSSLAPAALTHRWVENRLRHSPRLAGSPARTLAAVGAITAVVVGTSVLTGIQARAALRRPALHALALARADRPPLPEACASTDPVRLEADCAWGDAGGGRTILLVGDSHAAQWIPALDAAGREMGVRVVASVQGNCPSLGVAWESELPSCGERRRHIPTLIGRLAPDLVVVSHSVGYLGALAGQGGAGVNTGLAGEVWSAGLERFATGLARTGTPLAVILDTPRHGADPIDCLSRRGAAGCDLARDDVLRVLAPFHAAETDALRRAGHGSAFDPLALLCEGDVCPARRAGLVTYSDAHHLTASYSESLAGPLGVFVQSVLRAPSPT